MTQLSKHWRWYLALLVVLGVAVNVLVLWQLPFPSSVLFLAMAYNLGRTVMKVQALERWRDTELAIEQDLAERERRGAANVTH